jgi:hypothetical protein
MSSFLFALTCGPLIRKKITKLYNFLPKTGLLFGFLFGTEREGKQMVVMVREMLQLYRKYSMYRILQNR